MNFFEGQFSSFEDTLNCELAGRYAPSSALLQDGVEQAVEQQPARAPQCLVHQATEACNAWQFAKVSGYPRRVSNLR